MLVRPFTRLIVLLGPLLFVVYLLFTYIDGSSRVNQALHWSKDLENVVGYSPSRLLNPGVLVDEAESIAFENDDIDDVPAEAAASTPRISPPPLPANHEPDRVVDNAVPTEATPENHEAGHVVADIVPTESPVSEPELHSSLNLPIPSPPTTDNRVNSSKYHEIFSVSTADRKYFTVDFGPDNPTMNPNIIPHPTEKDKWFIIAQRTKNSTASIELFEEIFCTAAFQDGSLKCTHPPKVLPVASTKGGNCKGEVDYFDLMKGPHDMRVSYGPHAPIAVFGSQSAHTCFGMWAQDFRTLVDGFPVEETTYDIFTQPTELQRPPPWQDLEKNWFLFWDIDGQVYVHHDITPKRVFTKLFPDGSIGDDIAPLAAANDDICMNKYIPKPGPRKESLHQATNSLSITLCKRSDPTCHPSLTNTFILTIFHHKIVHGYHAAYEPYVMLFRPSAPFELYAISENPIWISGRGFLSDEVYKAQVPEEENWPEGPESEMVYVTSLSWGRQGGKYHGFLDDVVLLGFGIEDGRSGGIDVLGGDLLGGVGVCGAGAH